MLRQGPTATCLFQLLSVDIVGPLLYSISGYTNILSFQDVFRKFLILLPLRQATAKHVSLNFENNVISVYETPQKVIMDNGGPFVGKLFHDVLKRYDIESWHINIYHS